MRSVKNVERRSYRRKQRKSRGRSRRKSLRRTLLKNEMRRSIRKTRRQTSGNLPKHFSEAPPAYPEIVYKPPKKGGSTQKEKPIERF